MRRKLTICNSNKMQPLIKVSKTWQTIPAGSLKMREPTYNHTKLNLVTELDEPRTSSLAKPRKWNIFIVKFQNLKHKLLSLESTKRKLM